MENLLSEQTIDIIGYFASLFVAISLSLRSVWKMRWINLIGCLLFTFYGILLKAWPLAIANGYISLMNVWYLIDLSKATACFKIDELENIGENYFDKFYKFYEDDIRSFFPAISYDDLKKAKTHIMFRNMIPVGVFAYNMENEDTAQVLMDYVVPKFRDFKFGSYLYERKSYIFRDKKIAKLKVKTSVLAHEKYLLKLGFKKSQKNEASEMHFVKEIT